MLGLSQTSWGCGYPADAVGDLITKVTQHCPSGFRLWNPEAEGWLTWCTACVDYHMEHSGHNPEVQNPTDFQYYVARHGVRSDYHQRTHEELIGDVNVLHDFTRKLVKEKNQMQAALTKAQRKADRASLKLWVVLGALCGEGAVLSWLAHEFLLRFK